MSFPDRSMLLSVLLLVGFEGAVSSCAAAAAPACDSNLTANDPSCPADWAAARARCSASPVTCSASALGCHYLGAGDVVGTGASECAATALLVCTADGGMGEWRCAQ